MWILTLICKNRQDPCELIIVYYIVFNYTHVQTYTHTYTPTHTDTHIYTHTHVRTHAHTHMPTAQENAQKHLQTFTASRHLYTKFADSCGYSRLRSCLFERAQVNSGRTICADDFKAQSCVLRLFHAADTCPTLVCVIHGTHPLLRRSCHFSVATV